MKKTFIYQVILFLVTILCADAFTQTVNTGADASATLKAGVMYRSFGGGSTQNKVILGTPSVTNPPYDFSISGANSNLPSSWVSSNHIRFRYVKADGKIYSKVGDNTEISYTTGDLGTINYLLLDIKNSSQGTVFFNSVNITNPTTNYSPSPNSQQYWNFTGFDGSGGFSLEGDIVLTGSHSNGDATYLQLAIGSVAITDPYAPDVTNLKVTPGFVQVGGSVTLEATVDDSQKGGSNIQYAKYYIDGAGPYNMTPVNALDSPVEDFTATISGFSCGTHTLYVIGADVENNVSNDLTDVINFSAYELATISGTIDVAGSGVGGVIVKLILLDGTPEEVGSTQSAPGSPEGYYEFDSVIPDVYRIEIVTPLGFVSSPEDGVSNEIDVPLCSDPAAVNFTLTPVAVVNDARGKGYWKHQFDVYLKNKGTAQETEAQLTSYVNAIGNHYIPHFSDIFTASTNWQYWSDILSYGGPDMYQKAKAQLAALILNMASLKISQTEVVTMDGRDVADVITHASTILSDADATKAQLELAKNIAEAVCNQVMIGAGLVIDYNILYKNGRWVEGSAPAEDALYSNYPNPFNPATVISYAIAKDGFVTLKVYDLLGREVATLVNEKQSQGIYSVNFDASKLTSGIYIYKIQSDNFVSTKKMILVK